MNSQHVFHCICYKLVVHPTPQEGAWTCGKITKSNHFLTHKRKTLSPRPHLNECTHFKWCTCNSTTKWPKGDCLSSYKSPCGLGSPLIFNKRKIFGAIRFRSTFANHGALGVSYTMFTHSSKMIRTCKS